MEREKDYCVQCRREKISQVALLQKRERQYRDLDPCVVAEPDKVLVGEINEWVANPIGPGQTSALQIKEVPSPLLMLSSH